VVAAKFGGGQFMLSNFVSSVCGGWGSEKRLSEVQDFFAGREVHHNTTANIVTR
jgi:hypothetical protein